MTTNLLPGSTTTLLAADVRRGDIIRRDTANGASNLKVDDVTHTVVRHPLAGGIFVRIEGHTIGTYGDTPRVLAYSGDDELTVTIATI